MQEIARPMEDCGYETSLAYFTRHVDPEEPWLIMHLNELAESDFDLLLGAKQNFHIIHCSRSHEYFGHSPFQFEKLCELGFNICLGTDSLASNDDLNLFAEMRAFQKEFPNISPEEVLNMVTVNSAHALLEEDALGKIRPNDLAALITVTCTCPRASAHEGTRSLSGVVEVLSFAPRVTVSMIRAEAYD